MTRRFRATRHPAPADDASSAASVADAVAASERHYSSLVESLGGIVWEADPDTFQFLFVSPQAEAILGYPAGQWLEEPDFWRTHTHPDDVEWCIAFCLDATAHGRDHQFEYRMIAADGHVVWLRDIVTVTTTRDGRKRLRGFMVDITDRKAAAEAVRRQHRLYRSLLEHSSDNIALFSADGQTVYQTPAVTRQLGYTPEELVGRNNSGLVHPDDLPSAKEWFTEILSTDVARSRLRARARHKDGSWRALEMVGSRFLDESGELFVVINTRDVTDVVEATEALRESEQRLQLALEVASIGIVESDLKSGRITMSESYRRICGFESHSEQLSDEAFFDRVYPDDRETVRKAYEDSLAGRDVPELHYRMVLPGGHVRWLAARARAFVDEHGHPARAIGVVMDVTERKHLEEQFRQAQKLDAIGQLAGGVAHDFNNLLTVITGYTETVRSMLAPGDPHASDVEEIRRAAERASVLTRQLLAFSRKQVLRPTVLDLNAAVRDVGAMITRLIGENISLRLDLSNGPAPILADQGQIEQVLMNVAVNARDAMPFGGVFTMRTAVVDIDAAHAATQFPLVAGRYVSLVMEDTGVGMPPNVQARVFEPFFTTKEPGKGTGLGLSTVYGIVKQSGGFIFLDSEVGRGASLTIYLPLSTGLVAMKEPAARTDAPRGTETILLVEDERTVRHLASEVLTRQGYRLLAAASGSDALALCREFAGPIHLVITDVVMAGISGPELASRIEAVRPGVSVLYMSGYAAETIVHHGVAEEGVSFLEKPFTPAALAQKVREVLDTPKHIVP